jgi:acyl carrier protein
VRLAGLAGRGVDVQVVAADVSEREQVRLVLEGIDVAHPLVGVVHAAGVLDDGALVGQSGARLAGVLGAKAGGAWHLHELTAGAKLDFFVLFSSAASVLGSRGQGNYAAANACLDALAQARRARGLPALSINWGAWAEVGMAARLVAAQAEQLAAQGVGAITPAQGLAALAALLRQHTPQAALLPINWALFLRGDTEDNAFYDVFRAQAQAAAPPSPVAATQTIREQLAQATAEQSVRLLLAYVQNAVAQALQMQELPAAQAGFNELGMDSLMTIDLRRRLEKGLHMTLPATIAFEYPTVEALAGYLLSALAPAPPEPARADAAQQDAAAAVDQAIADLSEAELDELLEQELAFLKEE